MTEPLTDGQFTPQYELLQDQFGDAWTKALRAIAKKLHGSKLVEPYDSRNGMLDGLSAEEKAQVIDTFWKAMPPSFTSAEPIVVNGNPTWWVAHVKPDMQNLAWVRSSDLMVFYQSADIPKEYANGAIIEAVLDSMETMTDAVNNLLPSLNSGPAVFVDLRAAQREDVFSVAEDERQQDSGEGTDQGEAQQGSSAGTVVAVTAVAVVVGALGWFLLSRDR